MRIITANVNGIRSAAKKGFFDWLVQEDADVVCLQEIKAQAENLSDPAFHPPGYHYAFHHAEKKGYSGVGIYSKIKPQVVSTSLGWDIADREGRYIEADFGDLCVASLYMPSGTSGVGRQDVKYDFLARFAEHLHKVRASGKHFIICGDWNIAHRQIDLKNWRTNQKTSGFLPDERAWLDQVFGEWGFVDAFRHMNADPDQYTWWSNRGQAWAKNVGWRIDYHVITPSLSNAIKNVSIYKDTRFSDHAPVVIDYDLSLLRL